MKRLTIICLISLFCGLFLAGKLFANEIDDFRFSVGLYADGNYRLAKSELNKFIERYPESQLLENAKFLLANITLTENDYPVAVRLFDDLHKTGTDPSLKPEVLLGLAQSLFFTDNHTRAFTHLNTFVKDFRQHRLLWKAHFLLGRIEFTRSNYQAALKHFNTAEPLTTDWTVRIYRLNTLLQVGNALEAETTIKKLLEGQIKNEFVYQMIVIYLNHQLKQKAYRTVSTFAEGYIPQTSQYYDDYLIVIGEAMIEQANYSAALTTLARMKQPSERSRYLTALSYLRTDKDNEAERMFSDLSNNAVNQEIRSNSFFFLAGLRGKRDIAETNRMLNQFIKDNPKHPFAGTANYQLGLNHFTANSFGDAINNLTKAVNEGIDAELKEKATYLIAESYFQLQHSTEAIQQFNSYLNNYPQGVFTDEVLFKSGLHYFRVQDYPNAFVRFDRLINDFPKSSRISMANFYQGEIFTSRSQYDLAFGKYQTALKDFEDKGLIWLRIAQINFHLGKFDEALKNLNDVPDTPIFLFEKQTIKGNSLFAKRDYLNALRAFEGASKAAATDAALEDALVRQARTLYQLNEYREALNLYRRILQLNPKEQYLLMAGTVAFTANDFRAAIGFYNRYLEEYPEGRDFYRAKLHLADSFYNLKDYPRAASFYHQLVLPAMERVILINSLNGLEWSASQSTEIDFESMLQASITPDSPLSFRLLLQTRLVNYYSDKSRWDDVITLSRNIVELAPSDFSTKDVELLMAKALTRRRLFDKAEEVYVKLNRQKPDAIVFYNWAELHLLQQDSLAALTRIRQATELSRESTIWLHKLRLGVALKNSSFLSDYERYLSFAKNVEREQAQLLWIKWHLRENKPDTAKPLIDTLLKSEYEPIKARAQYYKGVHLYRTGKIQDAIPELLRVRYLYPRIEDVRLDAELLAIYAYLDINERDNALKLYDTIRSSLPQTERDALRKLLRLEGQ